MRLNELEKLVKKNLPDANISIQGPVMTIENKGETRLVEYYQEGNYLVHHKGPYYGDQVINYILDSFKVFYFKPAIEDKILTFKEAIELANTIGIQEEKQEGNRSIVLVLKDDSELVFISMYEEDWSDDTPGMGIEPPTVHLRRRN